MSGLFASWQPIYANAGIPTFPVKGKRPAVSNFLRAGAPASREWAGRFADVDTFGFVCGPRTGLTILDVDAANENLLADCLAICGDTPVIARTHSGKFHAYYKHNGERRRIRPDKSRPVDILGRNGFAVAPPSLGELGAYGFVSGGIDDLASLPVMRSQLAPEPTRPDTEAIEADNVPVGERNNTLWRACMTQARSCASQSELLEYAADVNRRDLAEPLPPPEVAQIASSAWEKQQAGENWFGTGERLVLSFDEIDGLMQDDPDAFMLLTILRRNHDGLRNTFVVANAMRASMPGGGWTLRRFASARSRLESCGLLRLIHQASRTNGPARYSFATMKNRRD